MFSCLGRSYQWSKRGWSQHQCHNGFEYHVLTLVDTEMRLGPMKDNSHRKGTVMGYFLCSEFAKSTQLVPSSRSTAVSHLDYLLIYFAFKANPRYVPQRPYALWPF